MVIAIPAPGAAQILRPLDPEAASLLDQIDYASVGVITFLFDDEAITLPDEGTGVLVPPGTPVPTGPNAGERFNITALTFLDRKWPHLALPGRRLIRASIGRIDDDRMAQLTDAEILEKVTAELGILLELSDAPLSTSLVRWKDALPQYRVNHLMRVAGIEAAVDRLKDVTICGAALHGIGIPACVGSGRSAGRELLAELTSSP